MSACAHSGQCPAKDHNLEAASRLQSTSGEHHHAGLMDARDKQLAVHLSEHRLQAPGLRVQAHPVDA
jgi:hypothetical protein